MKKITKIVAALLLLSMALTLCACGNDANPNTQPAPTTTQPVPTTTQPVPTPTQPVPTTTVDDGKEEYVVTVLYPDGTPVVGKNVIVCVTTEGGACSMPTKTNEAGVAVIRMEPGETMGAKVISTVEGYQKMEDYAYFDGDAKEITITLVPVAAE